MRITIVIGAFLPMPPAPTGAIEKVWHRLSEAFAARGHDVTVLCPAQDGASREERVAGVRYLRFKRRSRTGSTRLDLVKDLAYSIGVWRALPASDVTVTNCFWLPALLRVARRATAGALNVHAQRFPKGQFRLYRTADRISTVSDAIADAIRAQTPAVAPIVRVIPNPVDIDVFRPDGPSRRDASERQVLFTGRIHPEKGLELLVRAAAVARRTVPTLSLRLVGPSEVERGGGGARFLDLLRSRAADLPLAFGANVADPVELATTLRSCDAYCYPSIAFHGEASPVAPLEAIACGAPTIVSDLPQFAGYLRDGETGLVFAREAPDAELRLAECLVRVLTDRELASRLSAAGVARARELSIDRIADAHLADFAELVDARRRTRQDRA